jgi:MFS transporter, OFA family, oxalate/formate antiporter
MNSLQAKRHGMMIVAAAWLASFCLFGYRATFAIMKVSMAKDMHWSAANITSGYSLLMSIYAVTAFFSGLIIDRWGTKPCYFIAAIFGALGFWVTSGVHGLGAYYVAFGVLGGIGTGMLWVTSTISVRKWYVGKEYARMVGLAFMGGPMAQIALGLLVKTVIPVYGWRFAARMLAVIVLIAMLLATALTKKDPKAYGLKPFGSSPDKAYKADSVWNLKEAFTTYPIWAVIFTFIGSLIGEHLVWSQMVSYFVDDLGMTLNMAVCLYTTIGLFGIFSMPGMGIVADKVVHAVRHEARGRKISLIAGPLVGAVACILLLLTSKSIAFGVLACLLFAVYWAVIPGAVVGYSGSIYGQKSLGKIWGMATLFCMGIGPASGSFLGGYIRDHTGNYRASIYFALGSFLVSSIFALSLPIAAISRRSTQEDLLDEKAA